MRNKKIRSENVTKIAQISPGEGLSEGLRGTHGELMTRDSGNSDNSFWRTQGSPPLGSTGDNAVLVLQGVWREQHLPARAVAQ